MRNLKTKITDRLRGAVGEDVCNTASDLARLQDGTMTVLAITSAAGNVSVKDTHGLIAFVSTGHTATLPLAGDVAAGTVVRIKNANSGSATVAGSGSDLIDGSATLALGAWGKATLVADGSTNWFTI